MTATAPAAYRPEEIFPRRLFIEQTLFAAMIWAGFSLFVFAVTFAVSLFREIEISGWYIGGQVARWYGFVIGIYLGWSLFELYVTHGGTRAGFMRRMAAFIPPYGAALGLMFTLTFALEGVFYALAGWPHVLPEPQLFADMGDLPMIFVQSFLIFATWTAGGLFVSAAWYRSPLLGGLAIGLGLFFVGISAYLIGNGGGPLDGLRRILFGDTGIGAAIAIVLHLAMAGAMIALSWLALRDVPIHNKAEG